MADGYSVARQSGKAVDTTVLTEEGGQTTAATTVRDESREARDIALNAPMKEGVAASYDRLEALLAVTPREDPGET